MSAYQRLERLYKRVTWFGIFLNCLFVFPLLFAPRTFLDLLDLNVDPLIFARIPAILLLWISVFYIPATLDLKKYRVYAWLAIFPSRFGGATFFFGAVFIFGYPWGYLPIAIVDAAILAVQLVILAKVRKAEAAGGNVSGKTAPPRRWGWVWAAVALAVVLTGAGAWYKLLREEEQHFATMAESFKYGSIGTENAAGVPYWIWIALPRIFPEYLPGPGGYTALGMHTEQGKALPVGFSLKTIGFPRVGINCAICHSTTVRLSANELPTVLPGGGNTTVDVLGYVRFLFRCASDPRFTSARILAEIGTMYELSFLDRMLYRLVLIPATRRALRQQARDAAWTESRPYWGAGRIDPFNPVKASFLHVPVGNTIGNSDMMSIWNLRSRAKSAFHWDGLNTNLTEVVRSSALGDGATPKSIPLEKLERLQAWLMDLPVPKFPEERFPIDAVLAAAGKAIFARECGACHGADGARRGQVIPQPEVGTDPHRVKMWTPEAAKAYNAYGNSYAWDFGGFRSTDGYLAVPLDGLWTRGPYLHNGSVPSLRDLLQPPANRPKMFYRGYNVFDPKNVGYVSEGAEARRVGFRYDTAQPGNSNEGHLFGTALLPRDKEALLEFLKTL